MKNLFVYGLLAISLAFSLFNFFTGRKKIGYVRSGYVVENYKGMSDANQHIDKEIQKYRIVLDSLERRLMILKTNPPLHLKNNKEEMAYHLGIAQSELESYSKSANDKISTLQAEQGDKVIREINSFISDYGKKHGYDYILGTTNEGSILYGKEGDDLTNTILTELNSKK